MRRKVFWGLALVAALASLAVAGIATSATKQTKLDSVTVQLKWVTQAQFAGYYAAAAKGYYKANGLDVKIKVGGPDITPEQVVASGQAQFGLDWLPSLLAARDQGGKLINIAQVFNSSGMTELTWKSSGLTTIKSLAKKKVGVWCCGNQFELYAALTKNGIDPNSSSAVTIVNQPFDMNLFLQKKVDAAAAMTYNELAQVLETKNPATGKLYKLSDLNVLKMEAQGTGMLEDGVFVNSDWIGNAKNQDIAKRFLAATFQGWAYCRDNRAACVEHRAPERADARQGPPDVADERDQRHHLAEPAGDRRDERGGVQPDGGDREEVQGDQEAAVGRLPHRPREGGGRDGQGQGSQRLRRGLQEGRRRRHPGRQVGNEPREGDPPCQF